MNPKTKTLLEAFARVFVAILLLIILIYYVKSDKLIESLLKAWIPYLVLAVFYQFASIVVGSINQYILFQPFLSFPFKRFAQSYFKAFIAGLLFPGQMGDVSIVVFLKTEGLYYSQSLAVYIWDKCISFILYLGIALAVLAGLMGYPKLLSLILLLGFAALSALFLFSLFKFKLFKSFERWRERFVQLAQNTVSQIFTYGREHSTRLLVNCILTCFKFLLVILCYYAVFTSFGYSLSIWKVGLSSMASGIVAYVPISIHGIGTVEAIAMWILGRLNISPSDVLSGFLVLRAGLYLFSFFVFGLICLLDKKDRPR